MLSCDRRAFLSTVLALTVSGCGFAPIHGNVAPGHDLQGRVRVQSAPGRAGYFLVSGLRRRLGNPAEDYDYELSVDTMTTSRVVVIGARDERLRFEIRLVANYVLKERKDGSITAANDIEVLTSVDATESAYAAYAAEKNRIQDAAEAAVGRVLRDIYLHLALENS